MSVDMWKFTST